MLRDKATYSSEEDRDKNPAVSEQSFWPPEVLLLLPSQPPTAAAAAAVLPPAPQPTSSSFLPSALGVPSAG